MPTMNPFYPKVSNLVSANDFPAQLQFLQDGLQNVLGKIYYKDFQFVRSPDGSRAYYNITLVTGQALKIDLFGTGFSVILNPGSSTETVIPLSLSYDWPILGMINNFRLDGFSYMASELQNIFEQFIRLGDHDLLEVGISTFEGDLSLNSISRFVDEINTYYHLPANDQIPYPADGEEFEMIEKLRLSIEDNPILTQDIQGIIHDFYLNASLPNFSENLNQYCFAITGEDILDYIKKIIIPRIDASLLHISLGLGFPRNVLLPLTTTGGEPLPEPEEAVLVFDAGDLHFSTQGGIGFDEELSVSLNHPVQIGNTGLGLTLQRAKLDLSTTTNIIEADLDGRPADFMGVYVEEIGVTLPSKWFKNVNSATLQIAGYKMLVGTGGISGTIALEAVSGTQGANDYLYANLGDNGFRVGFNSFDLTFRQNAIVESNIRAKLEIPRFNKGNSSSEPLSVEVMGHLAENGDFNLTAALSPPLQANIANFVSFDFKSFEIGRQGSDFYLGTACEIWFENAVMNKILDGQRIVLPNIRIYSNGNFEIVGGNSFIPANISLKLGPVDMAVSGIHFGSYEQNGRQYNYWGFDGGISINPLGIDARGEGIKYYYTVDGGPKDSFLRIQTISVDLVIPGNASPASAFAIIHGMVSIPEPGDSPEYLGEISLKLPKMNLAAGASMKLSPKAPAFIVDAFLDLPAPIPIGPVGIYGFRAILGYRYVAEKEAAGLVSGVNTWYDYYVAPPRGIDIRKFSGPNRTKEYTAPFSLGAGAVIGTSFDSGTIISIRAMMLLSLPSMFMIEGRAVLISARLGLEDTKEPPFFAFVAWGDKSIEAGLGADFNLPQKGDKKGNILSLQAKVEALFPFKTPSAWYVNLGTKENPITARVFKNVIDLRAMAYLMLSAQGLETGARAEFNLAKSFFGIKVRIYAFAEVGGKISFERPQIGGYLHLGGGIEVNVWKVIFVGFDLSTYLSAEVAKPCKIFAELKFQGKLKLLFINIPFNIKLTLKWEKDESINIDPIPALPYQNNDEINNSVDRRNELVKGVHMLTNQIYDLDILWGAKGNMAENVNAANITKIIPLDTYIDIKSTKGLNPNPVSDKIGGYTVGGTVREHQEFIPPVSTVRGKQIRQVKHTYSITKIEIKAWNGNEWRDYHPFEALFEEGDRTPEIRNLKLGCWQLNGNRYDTIRIPATTPFSYLDAGEPGWFVPEQHGITATRMFCKGQIPNLRIVNVLNKNTGFTYYCNGIDAHEINGVFFNLTDAQDEMLSIQNGIASNTLVITNESNPHGRARSLGFSNYNSLVIHLPQSAVEVKLKLTTASSSVKIKYYEAHLPDNTSPVEMRLVSEVTKTRSELSSEIAYSNVLRPIVQIVVEPLAPPSNSQINAIREEIEALFVAGDAISSGIGIRAPLDPKRYLELRDNLRKLLLSGCTECSDDPCAEREVKLCDLYNILLEYFIFWEISSPNDLESDQFYGEFLNIIKQYVVVYPNIHLVVDPYYNHYATERWLLNKLRNDNASWSEILACYHRLWLYASQIMQAIYEAGHCGCDLDIDLKCTTSFQEVSWMSMEDYEYTLLTPGAAAREEDQSAMQEAATKTVQPVWRPNTKYYIHFTLKDTVNPGTEAEYNYYYGFKTSGGVGHYKGRSNDEKDTSLNLLARYIDYNRSYPNADGSLLQAKPLFWGNEQCKITLFFTHPFAYHLLKNWPPYLGMNKIESSINIKIKDPISDEIIPYPLPIGYERDTVPFPLDRPIWREDNDPRMPAGLQLLNTFVSEDGLPCTVYMNTLKPCSFAYSITLTNLKPQKLYTALVYNAFENEENAEIHNFVFQTSRYKNFTQQVESYLLKDEDGNQRKAKFDLSADLTAAELSNAYTIVSGNNVNIPELSLAYSHPFDRVLEGIFRFKPLEFAETTECNIIRNQQTGNIVALLIRNPEPFNNPKMPVSEVKETITVLTSGGAINQNFKVLHSKDYSQVLIMKTGNVINESELRIRFRYKLWDGSTYNVEEEVIAQLTLNE